jgi:hypothetical protein
LGQNGFNWQNSWKNPVLQTQFLALGAVLADLVAPAASQSVNRLLPGIGGISVYLAGA